MPTLRREDRDLAALSVLALLCTEPRHTYDIHRLLVDTGKRFVTGLPRSLYHAVVKLERTGFIEPVGTGRQGGRPERTMYAITREGRDEVRRRVELLLSTPWANADVTYAALSFVSVLPRDRAVAALRMRADALEAEASRLQEAHAGARDVPRLLLIETEFEIARARAERGWVSAIIDEIVSGELPWLDALPDGAG